MGIIDHHEDVLREVLVVGAGEDMIFSRGAWSPRMLKIPSVTMIARLRAPPATA